MARIDELARCSSEPERLSRLFLSDAHQEAARLVLRWMCEAGLHAEIDAIGNVVGRDRPAKSGLPTLIIGSHIDTVRDAGRYDGCLGVITAIEAVAALRDDGMSLPYAIEVIAFGDEEGVRFPEALSSSRAVAGSFDPAVLDLRDDDGTSFRDALRRFGGDPERVSALARRRENILGFLEVHIEQGPVLEAEDVPVGIVTAIAGASRLRVAISGQAGHAGTVPMHLRRDAFAGVAEMSLAVERTCIGTPGLVATIGRVELRPGAVNVVPGEAVFTIDVRSADDGTRQAAVDGIQRDFAAIAGRRNLGLIVEPFYAEAAAPCAPMFRTGLANAIARQGLRPIELPSGAGHDGLAMQALCPIGMLFVRCEGGVSHNPRESVSIADTAVALDVLVDFLRTFQPSL